MCLFQKECCELYGVRGNNVSLSEGVLRAVWSKRKQCVSFRRSAASCMELEETMCHFQKECCELYGVRGNNVSPTNSYSIEEL